MAFFDHYFAGGPTRVGRLITEGRDRWLYRHLARFIPQPARILEVGPGRGGFARLCMEKGHTYRAVDASPRGCALLRASGIDVVEAFVPPFPPSSTPYDAICAFAVLEHMACLDEAMMFLEGAKGQLSENGVVAVLAPELKAWGTDFWACDQTHRFPTCAQTTMYMLHDIGMETVFCGFVCGPLGGWCRFPLLALNKFNPARLQERLFGPKLPPRRLQKLKRGLSECFVIFRRKTPPPRPDGA